MDGMKPVSFVHISDTHIGDTDSFILYERNTSDATLKLIEHINSLTDIDFVVHTGDIVNKPTHDSKLLSASIFSQINKPTFFVSGNHDSPSIVDALQKGASERIDEQGAARYFYLNDYLFLLLNTQGPPSIDPHGIFPGYLEELVENFLQKNKAKNIVIFNHFPALPINSPWIDRDMLMINGERLHSQLLTCKSQILGYFFGHIHHQTTQIRDGILYVSAPSPFSEFRIYPDNQEAVIDSNLPISFNYVTLYGKDVILKNISITDK